jgi:hypothetical protein
MVIEWSELLAIGSVTIPTKLVGERMCIDEETIFWDFLPAIKEWLDDQRIVGQLNVPRHGENQTHLGERKVTVEFPSDVAAVAFRLRWLTDIESVIL